MPDVTQDLSQYAFYLKDVSISYEDVLVVDNISLEIPLGETFGLIGLNGAGKTTALKTMLGLKQKDSGEIYIEGKSTDDQDQKKNLAYLPERFEPPYFLKGHEFLKYSLNLYNKPYDREAALAAAETLALAPEALGRKITTYSKGMRQKLGLLATLLTPCHNIILDEPMSGLDPKARLLVKSAIDHARAEKRTVFLSSHVLSDLQEICDRVGILHNKKLVYVGDPNDVLKATGENTLEKAFLHLIENEKNDKKAA